MLQAGDVFAQLARQLPEHHRALVTLADDTFALQSKRRRWTFELLVMRDESVAFDREAKVVWRLLVPAPRRVDIQQTIEAAVDRQQRRAAHIVAQPVLTLHAGIEDALPSRIAPAAGPI